MDDFHEAEYCIPNCKYARKSRNQPMIECDNCRNWYHTKCLEFTDESFKKYAGNGKEWYCPKCKEEDNESNKNSEEGMVFGLFEVFVFGNLLLTFLVFFFVLVW